MGVNLAEFWHLTPHTLQLIAQGYNIALKRQIEHDNAIAHLQGAYFAEALASTVVNMFASKTAKRHEYPEKPYDLDLDDNREEKEKERQLELFRAQLSARMSNFNLTHEQGQS